jgi:hypothetical protein
MNRDESNSRNLQKLQINILEDSEWECNQFFPAY